MADRSFETVGKAASSWRPIDRHIDLYSHGRGGGKMVGDERYPGNVCRVMDLLVLLRPIHSYIFTYSSELLMDSKGPLVLLGPPTTRQPTSRDFTRKWCQQ